MSRTQLNNYGIERNFKEIEEALTSFLLYIQLAKQFMIVYTNSNQVRELITSQSHIEVQPFDNHVPESKEVNLFFLDDHLIQSNYQQEDKVCLHETMLLRRRPD